VKCGLKRQPTSTAALALLAVSYGVLALRGAGVVPMSGAWRALMIPGYLTFLGAVVLSRNLVSSGLASWNQIGERPPYE
jgi:hypothetical protein